MSWLWTWLFEYASSSDDSQTEAEILYEVDHEDKKKNGSTSSAAKSCDPSGETLLKHAEQASTSSKGPRSSICVSNQKKPKAEPVSAKAKAALESKATLHAKKVEEDFLVAKLSKPTKKKSANTEKKSTTGKRKPHQKATARKQKSEQLKNNGNTKADEDVSGMKKERTLAFVPSEENQDTKRGWRKEKPLAAVKVIHKASSFSGDCTNVKQDITKKKRHPLKTHQSGNIQHEGPVIMNRNHCPQGRKEIKKMRRQLKPTVHQRMKSLSLLNSKPSRPLIAAERSGCETSQRP